jgi:hypothetical protein
VAVVERAGAMNKVEIRVFRDGSWTTLGTFDFRDGALWGADMIGTHVQEKIAEEAGKALADSGENDTGIVHAGALKFSWQLILGGSNDGP